MRVDAAGCIEGEQPAAEASEALRNSLSHLAETDQPDRCPLQSHSIELRPPAPKTFLTYLAIGAHDVAADAQHKADRQFSGWNSSRSGTMVIQTPRLVAASTSMLS